MPGRDMNTSHIGSGANPNVNQGSGTQIANAGSGTQTVDQSRGEKSSWKKVIIAVAGAAVAVGGAVTAYFKYMK